MNARSGTTEGRKAGSKQGSGRLGLFASLAAYPLRSPASRQKPHSSSAHSERARGTARRRWGKRSAVGVVGIEARETVPPARRAAVCVLV